MTEHHPQPILIRQYEQFQVNLSSVRYRPRLHPNDDLELMRQMGGVAFHQTIQSALGD